MKDYQMKEEAAQSEPKQKISKRQMLKERINTSGATIRDGVGRIGTATGKAVGEGFKRIDTATGKAVSRVRTGVSNAISRIALKVEQKEQKAKSRVQKSINKMNPRLGVTEGPNKKLMKKAMRASKSAARAGKVRETMRRFNVRLR